MDRRQCLSAVGVVVVGALAGCTETVSEVAERTGGQVENESERAVNESLSDLKRPPSADVTVESDGTVLVRSLEPDTVGVMCGLPETDDPVAEVRNRERAVTGPGAIEGCDRERIVAVNEAGDIAVVERLE